MPDEQQGASDHQQDQGAPDTQDTGTGETQEQQEWRLSQEDFGTLVGAVRHLYEQGQQQQQQAPVDDDFDPEDADIPELMERLVDSRFQEITPLLEAQMNEQGEKMMNRLFDSAEKELGKFDRKLAERAAHSFFAEYGYDQRYAQHAAVEGARYAATQEKTIKKAAIKEYKDSLKKQPFSDPDISGGGERSAKPFKTMDEVISHWSGEEEV